MPTSPRDLIGRIINPGPRAEHAAAAGRAPRVIPTEPLDVLIGRMCAAPGRAVRAEVRTATHSEPPLRAEIVAAQPAPPLTAEVIAPGAAAAPARGASPTP